MTTVFQTFVVHLPPTPLGLLPARWSVEHWCTICRSKVDSGDLIEHAQDHANPTSTG